MWCRLDERATPGAHLEITRTLFLIALRPEMRGWRLARDRKPFVTAIRSTHCWIASRQSVDLVYLFLRLACRPNAKHDRPTVLSMITDCLATAACRHMRRLATGVRCRLRLSLGK